MRIIFANGRQIYPLFQGGDGISFHHLLYQLQTDGHIVCAIGKTNPPHIGLPVSKVVKKLSDFNVKTTINSDGVVKYAHSGGYECRLLEHQTFSQQLAKEMDLFSPDIVLTQLDNSQDVINVASTQNIKVVHFIHDHDPLNYLPINMSRLISHVIFNSKSTSRHFKPLLSCKSSIVYPPIKLEEYFCERRTPTFITMINPTVSKGVRIVEALCSHFPNERFLLVKGWHKPEFSNQLASNVMVWDRQYDMKRVYSQTKILLIPSQWEESFGRVIPEAGVNQIPIVASKVGGISESTGRGGLLVDNFNDPDAWVEVIEQLLADSKLANRIGRIAFKQAQKFDFSKIYRQLISIFDTVDHS